MEVKFSSGPGEAKKTFRQDFRNDTKTKMFAPTLNGIGNSATENLSARRWKVL